ncbi:MAG: hypothetical protein IJ088_14850, partial [Clostridia bacterium]|nr:hypothetical protein [Clostridia bacterium]
MQEIKSGGASDFKLPVWKLASMSLDWCIMGYGTGQFTGVKGKDNLRVLRLLGNAGVNVRLQGDVQFIFGGIVTVGVTGSLNAIVSAGLGVNLFMARNGNSLSLQSFKFSPANSGLKISVRLEIGVFVGIGFKGILGVTVTGYGFLELLFRWGGATEFSLIGGFGARLTAQFFFVKLIKQLGDEVKYQLLPEFKRLSRNQIMLERFLSMFEPARAVADSKDKSPDVTTSQPYNKKLLLKSESGTDLSGVQGESLSVVRIESGDGQAQKKDYVFYMARESSSSKVGLYYRQIGPQMETASHSVLGLINNFHSGHETRFYIQDGLSYADVRTWDVVGFSVEVQRLKKYGVQQFSKHDLIVITMLMANEYREITAGDGTVTKVPKKTAAIVATFVNSDNGIEMATFTANPNIGTTPGTTVSCSSAACIFLVADENAEPVCRPQTESEVFLYDSGESSRTKDVLEDEVKHNYWIRLMVSPVSPAAGEKVKSFTIRLSLASDTPVGQIESRTLGQGNSGIQNYTFENVQAGVQSIPNHPYEKTASASGSSTSRVPAVQDHWYACAAPTGKSEERKLAVNYHFRDNEGLFVLDEDPILDFRIFKKEPLDGDSATSHASEHIVYLVKGADGKMNRLRCVYVTGQAVSSDTMYMRLDEAHLTDYDVGVSAARIHVSRIFKVPLVWWVETVSAEENGEKKALWAIRGCWMDDTLSQTYMSKPMTFALIQADQVNNPAGPVFFDLIEDSRDGNSGITGYYAIKSQDSSGGGNQVRLNRFFFKLTPGLDLLSAGFTKDIANAGSYDDVQIAIHNNGNMMISTFDLGVYHNNTKLQTIQVDMENHDRSYCEILHGKESGGTSPEKRYGSTAVHLIRSGLSSSDEDRWAVRKWTYERSGKINKVKEQKTATLSMPDSYDAVMVSVKIPHNWTGDYSVDLQVDKIEVRDRMNFQLKTAGSQAGTGALLPVNRLLRPAVALADDTALQTVGDLHSLQRGSDSGWVPDGQLSPEADDLMLSTDVTFDRLSVDMDPTDIELDVDVWYDGEEEMATLYLNENAVVSESGGKQVVVLRSYVDDEEEPSFEWVF